MSEDALTVAAQIPATLRPAVADKLTPAAQVPVAEQLPPHGMTPQACCAH